MRANSDAQRRSMAWATLAFSGRRNRLLRPFPQYVACADRAFWCCSGRHLRLASINRSRHHELRDSLLGAAGYYMRNSLLPSDDELPTWLHTVLIFLVVSPFAGFLFWFGLSALVSGYMEPIGGPDVGQTFFGNSPLQGVAARWAGLTLIVLGASFVAIAYRFSRLAGDGSWPRRLPWALLALSCLMLFLANRVFVV